MFSGLLQAHHFHMDMPLREMITELPEALSYHTGMPEFYLGALIATILVAGVVLIFRSLNA